MTSIITILTSNLWKLWIFPAQSNQSSIDSWLMWWVTQTMMIFKWIRHRLQACLIQASTTIRHFLIQCRCNFSLRSSSRAISMPLRRSSQQLQLISWVIRLFKDSTNTCSILPISKLEWIGHLQALEISLLQLWRNNTLLFTLRWRNGFQPGSSPHKLILMTKHALIS